MAIVYAASNGQQYTLRPLPMPYLALMRKLKQDRLALTRLILAGGVLPSPSNDAIEFMLKVHTDTAIELIDQIVDMTTNVQ